MVDKPKTSWVPTKMAPGEFKYVPKPDAAKHGKGETKYDKHFDYLLLNDVAVMIPTDEVGAVKKAYQRYAHNKAIVGEYSFRQRMVPHVHAHTIWLERKATDE